MSVEMDTLEKLADRQLDIGEEIERLISTVRTDRAVKKTVKYYGDKLRKLEQLWRIFEDGHERLRREYPAADNHAYFRNAYDMQVRGLYEKYSKDFTERARSGEITQLGSKDSQVSAPRQEASSVTDSTKIEEFEVSAGQRMEADVQGRLNELCIQEASFVEVAPSPSGDVIKILRRSRNAMESLSRVLKRIQEPSKEWSKAFCEVHQQRMMEYWMEVHGCHQLIFELITDPVQEGYELERFEELENEVLRMAEELTEVLRVEPQNVKQRSHPAAAMKLPKVTLPSFDGSYLRWRQFHDLFSEMVHKQDLGESQKMWYLKTHLSGEAERLIRHLPLSDENYESAWKLLVDRYDNTRLLVSALLNQLLNQPTILNENATNLKNLHDTTQECVMGLQNLGMDTSSWSPLLVHLLVSKLDRTTHGLYEQSLDQPKELQPLYGLLKFLETRFQALEALGSKGMRFERAQQGRFKGSSLVSTGIKLRCPFCEQPHAILSCTKFQKVTQSQQREVIRKNKLCFNCLKPGHFSSQCAASGCRKCGDKHNILLHMSRQQRPQPGGDPKMTHNDQSSRQAMVPMEANPTALSAVATTNKAYVLLSTVSIWAIGQAGRKVKCRAILDSGSQVNFVTSAFARKVGTEPMPGVLSISGIGTEHQTSRHRINLAIQSRITNYSVRLEAFILAKITMDQPTQHLNATRWNIPKNLELADPMLNHPGKIDLLIGAELFYQLLSIGQINLGANLPTLQNTVFGWIASGKVNIANNKAVHCGICTSDAQELNQQLERFWKLEEVTEGSHKMSHAEAECEAHFNRTMKQDNNGRFIVRLPFKQGPDTLGKSEETAMRRFYALERKLAKDPDLKKQYVDFMEEYLDLGHMELAKPSDLVGPHYFIPHHGVRNLDSTTTKLRVVFDASAKTSSNLSLNDILYTGPSIQDDLFTILLRFRLPRFVFTADVEKMYRQVQVAEDDRRFQLIIWRPNPEEPIKYYRLCTVTYGLTTAPYLAIKCLRQTTEVSWNSTQMKRVIRNNFYVDDVMAGADTLRNALNMQDNLQNTLQKACFHLRKWCSNHEALLRQIKTDDQAIQFDLYQDKDHHIKTLGLSWIPTCDEFNVRCVKVDNASKVTKRSILSEIAHLFDPLGFLSPVVITAKILLQKLWALELDWDAAVPMEIDTQWRQFRSSINELSRLRVPRHVIATATPKERQLHVFCDASGKAYGVAIYARVKHENGTISVRLLCAKSKVAPLKTTTIPRLELCAAQLGAELVQRVKQDLQWEQEPYYMWTDSEIVLAWLRSESSDYQTFVANRIAMVQRITASSNWRHVPSKLNPADLVSRGIEVKKLLVCSQWIFGPLFLHGPEETWPPNKTPGNNLLERRPLKISLPTMIQPEYLIHNIDHRNSFMFLQRVGAYVLRFVKRLRTTTDREKWTAELSVAELEEGLLLIVKEAQHEGFEEDLRCLHRKKEVNPSSILGSLAPFIDNKGIMRVGGRLEASSLSFDAKHPMLLPYNHIVTRLMISWVHTSNKHAGPQATLAIIRQRFWPVKGKALIRTILKKCVF